jgi:hypothetical protein
MTYIPNDHRWQTEVLIPGEQGRHYADVRGILMDAHKARDPQTVARYLWRLGPHVTDPVNAIRDLDHLRQIVGLTPTPREPDDPIAPMAPITDGNWHGNFLYGDYFSPACLAWTEERFERLLTWTLEQQLTHVLGNASQDNWGAPRGHPEWTTGTGRYANGFRWFEGRTLEHVVIPRLQRIRARGLQPVLGVLEFEELKGIAVDRAIGRSVELMEATWEHVALFQSGWEWDEIFPDSQQRFDFRKRWLTGVREAAHGRDVGFHDSPVKRLEGSGHDVYGAFGEIYPGHVVKLYQARRDASREEIAHECGLLADVARAQNTKLCVFEHSGQDTRIGPSYTLAEARQRGTAGWEAARRMLSAERTGTMNGRV